MHNNNKLQKYSFVIYLYTNWAVTERKQKEEEKRKFVLVELTKVSEVILVATRIVRSIIRNYAAKYNVDTI